MASRSASEGEVVDSETEKATTALPSGKGTSVNRRLRDALSPTPELSPRSPTDSYRSVSRDRSRSPYRAGRIPRGEKRRREEDYPSARSGYNTNHGRAHYDDRHQDGGRKRYGRDTHLNNDDRRERDQQGRKRPRTRSRSPPRGVPELRGGDRKSMQNGHHRRETSSDHFATGQSVSKSDSPFSRRPQSSTAEPTLWSSKVGGVNGNARSSLKFAEHDSDGRPIKDAAAATEPVAAPTDEGLTIEERRKRREAIKAKYKSQATPLLVQALEHGVSEATELANESPMTPRSEGSASPRTISTPGTPLSDSRAGSPPSFTITDDAELANTFAAPSEHSQADEPSAADYDPTMDMQEDKARHDIRQNTDGVSAAEYDETRMQDQDVLLPDAVVETTEALTTKIAPASDDMFASDNDDDDMFAPVAPKKTMDGDGDGGPGRAVPVNKAKELDMSLMDNWDDPEGYYRIILGELLDGRYQVQSNLGKGMFSNVVRCLDTNTQQLKAIKVVRNNETMTKAGAKEIDILQRLMDSDLEDKKHMIRLERSFTHKGHLCMVFENLSLNLREVLKKFGRDCGINLKAVRAYAQQMFLGLSLLRKCNILHADLKPDNVLVNEERNLLKICDLGSASDASENDITPYLVSRFYRAPEVILGVPYDFALDMWSIGCTLFELYTGKILFTGRTNNQMLRAMMECRGKFSLKMLKKAEFGAVHFDDQNLNFRSVEKDKITGRDVTRLINFQKPMRDLRSRVMAGAGKGDGKGLPDSELKELNLFVDLLDRCLALNPEKRITPAEALKHPFIHRAAGK